MQKRCVCPVCQKETTGPLSLTYRAEYDERVSVCPKCLREIEKDNEAVVRSYGIGCLLTAGVMVVMFVTVMAITLAFNQ